MTSAQHRKWIAAGSPYRVARPIATIGARIAKYGYVVYYIGNNEHLDHIPPEDHTPFSETGWPIKTPYGVVTAFDLMPPAKKSGLPSLQQIGAQMVRDKNAGDPGMAWLKYINWGPVDNSHAVQDSWKPSYHRSSSSDTGHNHHSGRSDMTDYDVGNYDPVARILGTQTATSMDPTTTSGGMDMKFLARDDSTGAVYVCDLESSRWVQDETALDDMIYLAGQMPGLLARGVRGKESQEWANDGWVRKGWNEKAFGTVVGPKPPVKEPSK